MKRISIFLLAVLLVPTALFGQGQVVFANTSTTLFTTISSSGASGGMSGSNAFRIGLYIAPAGTVNPSLFTLVAIATNSPIVAGRFAYPQSPFAIPGNDGSPIAYQIRAWSSAAGESFEGVYGRVSDFGTGPEVYVGESSIGTVSPAIGGDPAPALFGAGDFPGQLTAGVTLISIGRLVVPEPSVYALAGLVIGLSLCGRTLWRRR